MTSARNPVFQILHVMHLMDGAISCCSREAASAGYMFNISMLKLIFSPVFEMHDIKQTGEYEATTRWTMAMVSNTLLSPMHMSTRNFPQSACLESNPALLLPTDFFESYYFTAAMEQASHQWSAGLLKS